VEPRRLALLVATYDFQDPELGRLAAPPHDAEALGSVLADPAIAGFEVTTLVNEPHHVVGEAIGELYGGRRRDDLTLLYFTGHGLKDEAGRLHLAMRNTRRERLAFTSISAEVVSDAAEECRSPQKVIILDCCYSGAFPAGRLAKADSEVHTLQRFRGQGRVVLTASDSTQYAFEGSRLVGDSGSQSVFTKYLVEGLRTGRADLDRDGDVSLDELYSYVYERVIDEVPGQRPKKQEDVEGRIVIARNVFWELPGHIRNAIESPMVRDRIGALDDLARLHQVGNDIVRRTLVEHVRRLHDDDSRTVSAKALRLSQTIGRIDTASTVDQRRVEREAREREAQEREAQEREAQAREAEERAAREREMREREAEERAAREREVQERADRERAARDREAEQRAAREREARERAARSRAAEQQKSEQHATATPRIKQLLTPLVGGAAPTTGWIRRFRGHSYPGRP
jgi:hypothetical protein